MSASDPLDKVQESTSPKTFWEGSSQGMKNAMLGLFTTSEAEGKVDFINTFQETLQVVNQIGHQIPGEMVHYNYGRMAQISQKLMMPVDFRYEPRLKGGKLIIAVTTRFSGSVVEVSLDDFVRVALMQGAAIAMHLAQNPPKNKAASLRGQGKTIIKQKDEEQPKEE